jgi:hypothetical protein
MHFLRRNLMSRFSLSCFISLVIVALSALPARATAPVLPPNAIAADTALVVHADASHLTREQVNATITALFGDNAAKLIDAAKPSLDTLNQLIAAGALAITVVANSSDAPGGDILDAPTYSFIQMKPGTDVKALEAIITPMLSPHDRETNVFEVAGDFLVMHEKGRAYPLKGDAARAAMFSDALGTITNTGIQVAFVPDAATRDAMNKAAADAPRGIKEALPLLASSKWITVGLTLGNAPSYVSNANAATDADAKAIVGDIDAAIADLKAKAAKGAGGGDFVALLAPTLVKAFDGVKPAQSGTKVTVTIGTEGLKVLADLAAGLSAIGTQQPGGGRGAGVGAVTPAKEKK